MYNYILYKSYCKYINSIIFTQSRIMLIKLQKKSIRMSTAAVSERLKAHFNQLTRAERQLADAILKNYPASALGSITSCR